MLPQHSNSLGQNEAAKEQYQDTGNTRTLAIPGHWQYQNDVAGRFLFYGRCSGILCLCGQLSVAEAALVLPQHNNLLRLGGGQCTIPGHWQYQDNRKLLGSLRALSGHISMHAYEESPIGWWAAPRTHEPPSQVLLEWIKKNRRLRRDLDLYDMVLMNLMTWF